MLLRTWLTVIDLMFHREDIPKDGLHKSVEKDDDDDDNDDKSAGGCQGTHSHTRAGIDKLEVMEHLVLHHSSGSSSRYYSASLQK